MGTLNEVRTPAETEFDHHDASLSRDEVVDEFRRLREQCPVVHSSHHGGFYHVVRYDGVRTVTTSPEFFSSADGIVQPPSPEMPRIPPLEFEGEQRAWWRQVMQAPMAPDAVREMQPAIDQIVREQIDTFATVGKAELVSALADRIPVRVIARMVGLSDALAPRLRELVYGIISSHASENFPRAMADFLEFTSAELESRRRAPQGDFLTQLADGSLGGRTLTDAEVGGILLSYLVGGHDSTAASILGLLHHVMTEDGLREAIVGNPGVLPKVIEESVRLTTPLPHFTRTVLQDTEVEGIAVSAGSRVMVNYFSANHDERKFENPDTFDYQRRRNAHFGFGYGVHLCIGRYLARAELTSTVTQLLTRLPDIQLDGEVRYSGLVGGSLMAIRELPVRFTPEKSGS